MQLWAGLLLYSCMADCMQFVQPCLMQAYLSLNFADSITHCLRAHKRQKFVCTPQQLAVVRAIVSHHGMLAAGLRANVWLQPQAYHISISLSAVGHAWHQHSRRCGWQAQGDDYRRVHVPSHQAKIIFGYSFSNHSGSVAGCCAAGVQPVRRKSIS